MQNSSILVSVAIVAVSLALFCIFLFSRPRSVVFLLQMMAAYIPSPIGLIAPLVPSVATIAALGSGFKKRKNVTSRPAIVWLLVLLAVVTTTHLFASSYSTSFYESLRWILWPAGFASVILLANRSIGDRSDSADGILLSAVKILQPFLVIQSATVLLFRLFPDLKLAYLRSAIGNVLTGGRSSLLWAGLPDNVLLADKSGGLWFVNANEGSMALGVGGLLCLGFALKPGPRLKFGLPISVLAFLGVAMSGSRTAILLLLALPATVLFVGLLIERSRSPLKFGVLILCSPVLALAVVGVSTVVSDVFTSADVSTNSRFRLWDAAWMAIQSDPLRGIGFGNWPNVWAPYAAFYAEPAQLPPHNFLLQEWVQSGLLSAAAVSLVFATPIVLGFASIRSRGVSFLLLAKVSAVAWVLAHGMFDATPFWGTPVLAVTLPLAMWSLCETTGSRMVGAGGSLLGPSRTFAAFAK